MNTVIKFPGMVAPISKPISRGSNVNTNRRSGYVICWRSLMAADWAKSAVKFAGWMRIISLAAYEESAVSYKGREWTLMRGQLESVNRHRFFSIMTHSNLPRFLAKFFKGALRRP